MNGCGRAFAEWKRGVFHGEKVNGFGFWRGNGGIDLGYWENVGQGRTTTQVWMAIIVGLLALLFSVYIHLF